MCGIFGIFVRDPNFRVNLDGLLDSGLDSIEDRGKHATGFVAIGDDGVLEWQKASCAASTFIKHRRPVPHGTRLVLGHTRWYTQGLPSFMENNHPIKRGPYFIIHNGHVSNDDKLFETSGRQPFGDVDSEAIAARLSSLGDLSSLHEVISEIEGTSAVAAVDERDCNRLVIARGNNSPLYVYKGKRIVIFGSTQESIVKAHAKFVGHIAVKNLGYVEEGTQLEWKDGEMHRTLFEYYNPPPVVSTSMYADSWSDYNYQESDWYRQRYGPTGQARPTTPITTPYVPPRQLTTVSQDFDEDPKDFICEFCNLAMTYKEAEFRYDAEEEDTLFLCNDCVLEWDMDLEDKQWEEDEKARHSLDDAEDAEWEVMRQSIHADLDDETSEDFETVNSSVLKRLFRI